MNFLKKDLKYEAKIARKRQQEEERKKRIFDPRVRLIGCDVDAWQGQLCEKKNIRNEEERIEKEYTRRMLEQEKICLQTQRKIDNQRRTLAKDMHTFWECYQNKQSRREFDLNDPDYIKKAQFKENSVVRFDGEDADFRQRLHKQKVQNQANLLQQMKEKRQLENEIKLVEHKIEKNQEELSKRARKLAEMEKLCRKKIEEATAEFNKLTAQERNAINREQAAKETKINAQEIENWVTGDFLTERLKRVDEFENELKTRSFQEDQIKQRKAKEEAQENEQKKWEIYNETIFREAFNREQMLLQQQRDLDRRLISKNEQLAEHHWREEAKRNNISDLHPTEEFFDQFNRSTY